MNEPVSIPPMADETGSHELNASLALRVDRYKRRRHRRRVPYVISLNLTAMIDTVFNLLFLFIIISRFGPHEGVLPAKLPARSVGSAVEVPRTPIRIRISARQGQPQSGLAAIDQLKLIDPSAGNDGAFDIAGLPAVLRRIHDSGRGFDRNTPVHLLAGEDVAWDHLVNAYNAAMAADFEKIYFAGAS